MVTDDEKVADGGYEQTPSRNNSHPRQDTSNQGTPHDNDADTRPRLYGRLVVPEGEIELTAEGAEGETMADIESVFDDKLTQLVKSQNEFVEDDEDADTRTFS